jgi:glycosyltransferase involved in cell wall biosynthesis
MPRVSVIVPTYNCAQFLGRALESAFAQSYRDFEVIVADDGSTDDTQEIISRLTQPLIYAYQENRGLSAARNLAISKASGEFLAYLDSDDMWFEQRLEKQVAFLDQNPRCGLVHSEVTVVDEEDRVLYPRFKEEAGRPILKGACAMHMLRTASMHVPSVLERTSCYDQAGPFDERLRSAEDYLHWLQILLHGHEIGYIDESLAMYRWRNGSLSKNESKMHQAMLSVYRILRDECHIGDRLGTAAEELVAQNIEKFAYSLAYLYRRDGSSRLARKVSLELLMDRPFTLRPYLEVAKSYAPAWLRRASALR